VSCPVLELLSTTLPLEAPNALIVVINFWGSINQKKRGAESYFLKIYKGPSNNSRIRKLFGLVS